MKHKFVFRVAGVAMFACGPLRLPKTRCVLMLLKCPSSKRLATLKNG